MHPEPTPLPTSPISTHAVRPDPASREGSRTRIQTLLAAPIGALLLLAGIGAAPPVLAAGPPAANTAHVHGWSAPQRTLPPGPLGSAKPDLLRAVRPASATASTSWYGHIPCDMYIAYSLNSVSQMGSGQTIVIVDAYSSGTEASDLATFSQAFGLSAPDLTIYPESGVTYDSSWAMEIALDLEWAHAMAPAAKIDLVEAATSQTPDLTAAISFALQNLAPNVISMSFGESESQATSGDVSLWQGAMVPTDAQGQPVAYVAATGDYGFGVQWPAADAQVTAVGGTSVQSAAFGGEPMSYHTSCSGAGAGGVSPSTETVWTGTGGGTSAITPKPSYQSGFGPAQGRATPDVSMDADPNTGVAVDVQGAWMTVGGTSLATPMWAALMARANQLRLTSGLPELSSPAWIYSARSSSFNDITQGNDAPAGTTACITDLTCVAQLGFDQTSGRGSPIGASLLANMVGTAPVSTAPVSTAPVAGAPAAGQYHPIVPTRVLDTRALSQVGPYSTPFGPGGVRTVSVANSTTIPSSGVLAVVVNVTATDTSAVSFLTIWPAGAAMPLASSLNWGVGQTVPNLVTVPVNGSEQISIYNDAGRADVVIDVAGYFTATSSAGAGSYEALSPARILDTRAASQLGPYGTAFGAGTVRSVQVTGQGGVPTSGVEAVILNVTATDTSQASYLTAWPAGAAAPLASNLNWGGPTTVANRVTVMVGSQGQIDLFNNAGSADVVVDVGGYYLDGSSASSGALYHPLSPTRVLDTRPQSQIGPYSQPLAAGGTISLTLAGQALIPSMTSVPHPVAVVLNVTATDTDANSYLTVYPSSLSVPPLASDLNWSGGATVANLVVATVGPNGAIELHNSQGQVDVIVDVLGWYG